MQPAHSLRFFYFPQVLTLIVSLLCSVSLLAQEPSASKPRYKASYSSSGIQSHSTAPATSGSAQQKVKVYQYTKADGSVVFADHAPGDQDFKVLLYTCYACKVDSELDWQKIPLFSADYDELIHSAARENKLDPALIRAVIHAESAFKVFALSRAGAMGLMQLMPNTAKAMGVNNPYRPDENIAGGARYLAKLLARFDGDIDLACAAYNAGPTTVAKYQGIPPYPETQAYVKRVKILLKRYQQAL
ncbi:lytic transglycosylase domain-containing protein [Shewanella sp. AS1]|uniref:lytic transglycosylase domain-containing protein n=1 Tax=Shewanella sp. AS1 TaxID=2907626 RepID=UPI001F31CE44|nr:lytic transglycosylase domain-containing protein [Shewanella sp. AS1]MCE9680390.1 lytic transglycosylase domain-containing protein [Shewanella sp. AS1]